MKTNNSAIRTLFNQKTYFAQKASFFPIHPILFFILVHFIGILYQFSQSPVFCQDKNEIKLKEGSILLYRVNSGSNVYDFIVGINKLGPDIDFGWGMTGKYKRTGNIIITPNALKSAIKQKNYFSPGKEILENKTTVWISQKVFDELSKKGSSIIDTGKSIETLKRVKKEKFNTIVDGLEKNINIMYCKSDKNNEYWIWDNPKRPIILKMKLYFEITLKEIFTPDTILNNKLSSEIKANIFNKYASVLNDLDKPQKAITYYEKALHFSEMVERSESQRANILKNLATIYLDVKDFENAILYFQKSLNYFHGIKDQEKSNEIVINLAKSYKETKGFGHLKKSSYTGEFTSDIFCFSISQILNQHGDSCIVLINAGENDGIIQGSKFEVLSVASKEHPNRKLEKTGKGEVLEVNYNSSKVGIVLADTSSSDYFIYAGDLVSIPIKVPKREVHSLFYDLVGLDIEFTDDEANPFYHYREILNIDSKELEYDILQTMINQIHKTAEAVKPKMNESPTWTKIIERGKFKGMNIIESMEKTGDSDLISFLRFVRNFPGKYMGKIWRIDETYATWILNNSPISHDELLDILLAAKNDSEINLLFETYRKDIVDGNFFDKWDIAAEQKAGNKKFDEAYNINELCQKTAIFLGKKDIMGWVLFSKAKILEKEQKFEEAIKTYNQAKDLFNSEVDLKGESYSLNNIATIYNDLNKFDEAIKFFNEALNVKIKITAIDSSSAIRESIGNTLWGKAFALYNLSRYNESLTIYSDAKKEYGKSSSIESSIQNASIYTRIGDVLEKLGNYRESIDNNQKAIKLYHEMANIAGEAKALNNIGYDHYKLGDYNSALGYYEQAYRLYVNSNNKNSAGFSKSSMGQMYWNLGEFEKAIGSHQQAIQLKEEADDKSGQAYSWSKLGSLYNKSGDPIKAIEAFKKASSIYEEIKDKSGIAATITELGDVYYNVKDYKKSIENYEKSLKIREEINSKYDIAETVLSLGNAYYSDKNYRKAKENFEKSLIIRQDIGDKSGQINCMVKLGFFLRFTENNDEFAMKYMNDALRIAQEIDSKSDIACCYSNLSKFYNVKGDYKTSLDLLEKSLKIYHDMGEKTAESDNLLSIGYLFLLKGEMDKSLDYYNRALTIAEATNSRNNIASSLTSIGEVYLLLGDYKKAIEMQRKSLKINEEVKNQWGIAGSLLSIGNIYNQVGDYRTAISFYNQADSIYKIIGDEFNRATPINNIGTIYFWQGDYDMALKQFNEVLDILNKIKFEGEFLAIVKSNIGEIYYEKKMYTEAEKWLNESIDISSKIGVKRINSSGLTTRGKLNLALNQYDRAKEDLSESYKIAVQINEKDRIAEISSQLGMLYYETKDFDSAIKYLEESIGISKTIGSTKFLWEPLFKLGLIYKNKKDIIKAIEYLKEAVSVMEDIRSKIVGGERAQKIFAKGESKAIIYETLVSLLVQQGDVNNALEFLERSNNEGLKEQFGRLDIKFNNKEKSRALEQDKSLKIKVDGMNEQLVREKSKPEKEQNRAKIEILEKERSIAENEYTKFINETIKEQPDLANHFRKNVNPLEFRKVKRLIPKDIAVISYLIGENQLYIFVATVDTIVAKVLDIKKSDLDMKINFLYSTLKSPLSSKALNTRTLQPEEDGKKYDYDTQIKSFKKFSEELHTILISSIKKEIEGKKKLAIIPNGELFYLPFQVLGTSQADGGFKFLVSEKSIFYIGSLNIFFSQKPEKASKLKILAFGNADNSLPNAELEVKDIKTIYPDAQVYLRENATKDKVKNLSSSINTIHFATHGNLDYGNFQNSYLTLAPNIKQNEDGKLTLEEIWQITNLYDCKLVTLSACNTAVGSEMIQGWLVNPANAFLDAGVQTVIASLWQVNDAATSILMKEFYKNLKIMDKIDALNKAQETLTQDPKYVDPYYWAAFVLVGDWR